jgi:AcrR family transcriptional regulator
MASEPLIDPGLLRLPPGQHGLDPADVRRSQQARLQLAMIDCVENEGYANTTLRDLARVAGVSPNVFSKIFQSKEQCFLETHDAIAAVEIERVSNAVAEAAGDWRERLLAGTAGFLGAIAAQPAAARLALVEIHAVGARALEHQQATLDAHEQLIASIFSTAPHGASVGETTRKALVAGARGVAQHQLLDGQAATLPVLAEPIVQWASSYHAPLPGPLHEPFARGRRGPARLPEVPAETPRRQARVLGHRARIMHAVASLCCEEGYAALRMPAITARAGVSNQTFYEHFPNKHEAFMACYDRVSRRALAAVLASFQAAPSWPEAARASIATLLEHIARDPEFARLGLFEVLAAGPDARRRADERAEAFTAMLTASAPRDGGAPLRLRGGLVAAGIWGVIQHHIIHGRARRLPELTPALSYVALAPFVEAQEAYRVAVGKPSRARPSARKRTPAAR